VSAAPTLLATGPVLPRWHLPPRPGEPGWLGRARSGAERWVAHHGLPTPTHEDWRYTRLGPVLEEPFEPAEGAPGNCLPEQALGALAKDLSGPRLVFLNGHLASSLSSTGGLPEGARVASLASALSSDPGELRPLWSPPATGYRHAFRALNDALATDGVFISLPPGLTVEAPIVLFFVSVAAPGRPFRARARWCWPARAARPRSSRSTPGAVAARP
jgi:Fe-S cluster assembly protein SufD